MRFEFYYSSDEREGPFKGDLKKFFMLLEQAEKGRIECKKVDTSKLAIEELSQAYFKAVVPSVHKKFRIRKVFGTRKNSGCFFGKQVPALLVFEDKTYPEDVYPHEEHGRVIEIEEYLKNKR